jgi:hypothetical protein
MVTVVVPAAPPGRVKLKTAESFKHENKKRVDQIIFLPGKLFIVFIDKVVFEVNKRCMWLSLIENSLHQHGKNFKYHF